MRPSEKQNASMVGVLLLLTILLLCVSWNSAGAQSGPTPTATPTVLIAPSPLPTTRPLIVPCPPWRSCAWLPIGAKA